MRLYNEIKWLYQIDTREDIELLYKRMLEEQQDWYEVKRLLSKKKKHCLWRQCSYKKALQMKISECIGTLTTIIYIRFSFVLTYENKIKGAEKMKIEWLIVKSILEDKDYCNTCLQSFEKSHFDDSVIKEIYGYIQGHYNKYGQIPSQDIIKQTVKKSNDLLDMIMAIDVDIGKNKQYVLDETDKYLKSQAYKRALVKGVSLAEKGTDPEKFRQIMDEALSKGLNQDSKYKTFFEKGYTLKELSEMNIPDIRWIVEGLIPEGLTILSGREKTGKSFLIFNIILDVVMGGMALGKFQCNKTDVLFLALEDSFRRIASRSKSLIQDMPDNCTVFTEWLPGTEGILYAERFIQENPTVKMIVVDTLAMVRDFRATNRNNPYLADYEVIKEWRQLALKHNISIVMITHNNKRQGETDPLSLVSGTTGLTGACDTVMVLQPYSKKNVDASLYIRGNDIEQSEFALSFQNGRWYYEDDVENYIASGRERDCLDCFEDVEKITAQKVKDRMDVSVPYAKKLIKSLFDKGLITRKSRGEYFRAGG